MQAVNTWLLSVTAAALLTAVVRSMMPQGSVKTVGTLACGLLLFLATAKPLLGLSWEQLADRAQALGREAEQSQQELEGVREELEQTVIDRRTAAYSRDVTAGLDAQLEIIWDYSSQPPQPSGADMTGALTQQQRSALLERLERELGLAPEQIHFHNTKEEP